MKKVLLTLLVLPLLAACTKKTDDILIGEYGSLTGETATFGLSSNKGFRMAFDEINAAGGIHGKKVKLITIDDQSKDSEALSAITRLITQDKVVAVLGEVASGRSKLAAPVAQKYQVPMITHASTNPSVTQKGDYIFRTCFIDPFQGFVGAKFAIQTLKAKKAAVFRDVKSEYSMGLADVFIKEFKKMGGEIVADLSYQEKDIDFKAQLTQVRSKNPDILYLSGYYGETGLIAQQARQLGIKATLLGGDGWDSARLHEIGKDAINGGYYSNHYTTESTDPLVVEFMKKYKAIYNETPDSMAALAYDAAKILAAAIDRTKEITSKNIRDELAKTTDFPGVTGKITLNADRDAVKSAVMVQVQGPERKFISTVSP